MFLYKTASLIKDDPAYNGFKWKRFIDIEICQMHISTNTPKNNRAKC